MSGLLQPTLARPRLQVLANGTPVAGVRSAEIESNNHYASDRFSVVFALGADQLWTADYWSSQAAIMLDVQIGFLPDGAPEGAVSWTSLLQGATDTIEIEVPSTVRIQGRDLSAGLIAARTQETFANQTSSDIVTTIAQRHNLTPQVTTTSTLVDRYYELEHDRITLNQFSRTTTEWDLLVFLAQQEGFDLFVQGTTLYFQPSNTDLSAPDLILRPRPTVNGPANLIELRMQRNLALAAGIDVTVRSWNSRQQNAYSQTATTGGGPGSGSSQSYVLVRPNLLADDAMKLAQTWLATLAQHERVISALMPGELTLTPRSTVGLEGTGTAFDQIYHIDTIERHLRFDGGFVQHVRAKNADVQS